MGACSCNCRKERASKHWLCKQIVERQGTEIRNVDKGHFKDMIDEVATISVSCAFETTVHIRSASALLSTY